jgi:cell division protein ZapA (FtsZ GTPase activity inhibitor)
MIENLKTEREYDILGFKLKVNPEEEGEQSKVTSQRVIEFVQKKISELKDRYPQLSDAQIAVLLAMESSRERLEIEEDFKQSVEFYDNQAQRVKDLVETIKPSYN